MKTILPGWTTATSHLLEIALLNPTLPPLQTRSFHPNHVRSAPRKMDSSPSRCRVQSRDRSSIVARCRPTRSFSRPSRATPLHPHLHQQRSSFRSRVASGDSHIPPTNSPPSHRPPLPQTQTPQPHLPLLPPTPLVRPPSDSILKSIAVVLVSPSTLTHSLILKLYATVSVVA
ncbi:hypothetical protein PGTUg99_014354 [Puccinia graminis f. sp. tritici]|uniref:Uncharacterized protein n=1 Tax=Puccinia graminis f. sp. tritici TaxID=56615 RepID=A0A5B0M422_PUCGR|nr:hypothetical protein PGTUg99_014354 [Puccinia graminis f. sp. tritici]